MDTLNMIKSLLLDCSQEDLEKIYLFMWELLSPKLLHKVEPKIK